MTHELRKKKKKCQFLYSVYVYVIFFYELIDKLSIKVNRIIIVVDLNVTQKKPSYFYFL